MTDDDLIYGALVDAGRDGASKAQLARVFPRINAKRLDESLWRLYLAGKVRCTYPTYFAKGKEAKYARYGRKRSP